jgi:hypothetical protein
LFVIHTFNSFMLLLLHWAQLDTGSAALTKNGVFQGSAIPLYRKVVSCSSTTNPSRTMLCLWTVKRLYAAHSLPFLKKLIGKIAAHLNCHVCWVFSNPHTISLRP